MIAECTLCKHTLPAHAPQCPRRRIGTVVANKYKILTLLGAGGMGAVYDAEHIALRRRVALKMLHPQFTNDVELNARFVREARESAAMQHPGIVAVHDSGVTEEGAAYLEMERLVGVDLREAIETVGVFDFERAIGIARSLLDALAATHARGVIHRDLKAQNVFLAQLPGGEQLKLLDFGFAKLANDDLHLTHPDQLLGSPLYMSPEQYRNPTTVDVRTDIYSAGVILFEMLTGKWPVTLGDKKELLRKIMRGDLERHPRVLRSDVPEWLDAVVARALAYNRDERFATALELKQALETGGGETIAAAPPEPEPEKKRSLLGKLFGRG